MASLPPRPVARSLCLDERTGDSLFPQYKNVLENTQHVPDNGLTGTTGRSNHPMIQRMNSLGNRVISPSFNNVEEATMPDVFWKKWGAGEASKAEQKQIEQMIKDQAKEP